MSLTLKIQIVRINQLKAMKFAPTMSVSEACATILEKVLTPLTMHLWITNQWNLQTGEGGEDHGLFQPAGEGKRGARWLRMDRTLQYYDLKINVCSYLLFCTITSVPNIIKGHTRIQKETSSFESEIAG